MNKEKIYCKSCQWAQNVDPKELFKYIENKNLDWLSIFGIIDGVAIREDNIFMGVFKKFYHKYNLTSEDLAVTLEHLMLSKNKNNEKNFIKIYKKYINSKDLADCYQYVSSKKF